MFGKAEAIPQVEQLVINVAELAVAGTEVIHSPQHQSPSGRCARNVASLAPPARVFWLADGVQEAVGAEEYLAAAR